MSRIVWRIGTDTPDFEAHDLSGAGAKRTGGRWNQQGTAVTYCSESRALACLETVVHLNAGGLPLNRYLVAVTIPDAVWSAARHMTVPNLPVGWDAEPAGRASIAFGTAWAQSGQCAVLVVPSVVVPEEFDALVNPNHPHAPSITATKRRRWLYDPRLVARS